MYFAANIILMITERTTRSWHLWRRTEMHRGF